MFIDVRTSSTSAVGGTAGAHRAAEQETRCRYKGQGHTLAVESRGGTACSDLDVLDNLS